MNESMNHFMNIQSTNIVIYRSAFEQSC